MPEEGKAAEVKTAIPMLSKSEVAGLALRLACLATSVVAFALVVTSEERATLSVYGFPVPVHSKWSFSQSLEFLAGVSAAAAAHSLLQLFLVARKMLSRLPVIGSRKHAWMLFAADQLFAYVMMSAGSASAGVANLHRTGIRHTALPDLCKPLRRFCDRTAASITFAFVSCTLLAISTALDVIWLSKN